MTAARWTPEAVLAKAGIFILPAEGVQGTAGAWFVGTRDGRGREFSTRNEAEIFAYELAVGAVEKAGQSHLVEVSSTYAADCSARAAVAAWAPIPGRDGLELLPSEKVSP